MALCLFSGMVGFFGITVVPSVIKRRLVEADKRFSAELAIPGPMLRRYFRRGHEGYA